MTTLELCAKTAIAKQVLVGPRTRPLVGNLLDIKRDPLRFFLEVSQAYGDVVPIQMGRERVLMINSPDYIKQILQDNYPNYRKSDFYAKLRPIFGDGIFLSEGDVWRQQRQAVQPAFHKEMIEKLASEVDSTVGDLLRRWHSKYGDGESFDVSPEMMRVTLDVVLRALFDVRLGNEADAVHDALTVILTEVERRIWSLTKIGEYLPTKRKRSFQRAMSTLDDFVNRIVERRRGDSTPHNDLLSMLLDRYGEPRDAQMLRDQIMSMVLAGHETTAGALSWSWYLLSKNPSVERRLKEEVGTVLGDRPPTIADLPRLSFARMVFEESMRLYPPVWTISRTALNDDVIGGVQVKAGTTVMLCPYAIHRSPRYWENPEGFDPERFSPDRSKLRHPYAYFPFGGGPRACIGKQFALTEGPLVLAGVMQSYRLEIVSGHPVEPVPMITMRSREGIRMTLRRDAATAKNAA